ncbi:MAG: MFS transporter [Minicystis sp.]
MNDDDQRERPGATGSDGPKRTPLEWVLNLFAEVRSGEGPTSAMLTLNVFLLLTAYYLLKTAREPLILVSGAEVKSYSSAGQALLLIPGTYVYGLIAQRVGRMRLIATVTLFFVANLIAFFVAGKAGVPYLGIAFFLWVGVFNMMIIAQFWSFAADIYGPESGKRLFAILGIGSTVGAVAGSGLARAVFKQIGEFGLMLAAAGVLLLALSVTFAVNRREAQKPGVKGAPKEEEALKEGSGWSLLLKDRYLMLVGALAFILNWVNTSGEYILDRTLVQAAKDSAPAGADIAKWSHQFIGDFKAEYFLYVNTVSVLMQLFIVSRIIKYLGVRVALFLVPAISLAGYSSLVFFPSLTVIFIVKIAENSMDYSVQNTSRQALWLVTSRDAKYKAKSVIDTFIVRAGDLLAAVVTGLGAYLHFATSHFILINIGLVLIWIALLVFLTRIYKTRSEAAEKENAAHEGGEALVSPAQLAVAK